MNLLIVIAIPFMGAVLAARCSQWGRSQAAWMAGLSPVLSLACLLPSVHFPFSSQTLIERHSWLPAAGLDLVFRLDGLGLLFALLILGIGVLVVLYASYYLSKQDRLGRFYVYLLVFMGSMLGIVLSENLIQLLIFWELTSLSSFLLVSYHYQQEEARTGAGMALAVTGVGGLALFGGVLLLGDIAGSYELSVILAAGDAIQAHPFYPPMLMLILLGAFTKSAQVPFHFWLPNAMTAPTPASAYLHSATMVKAGVFLLARLFPALSGTPEWAWLVGGTGLATLLLGAFFALFQHDIKGLLAYSTISHLGLITLLFGIGTPLAAVAGVFHIINHATFKASLFMAAGIIDHETGSRDMRKINGLWRYMPYTSVLAMVAAAAMAGVPLLNGFLSKEMFFAEIFDATTQIRFGWLLPGAVTLAGVFAVAYSLRFCHDIFFNGEPIGLSKTPHEPPRWMKLPMEVLVVLCLLVGIIPTVTVEPILVVAVTGVLQKPPPPHDLAIWHGVTPALWMSVIALIGGCMVYRSRQPLFTIYEHSLARVNAREWYDRLISGWFRLATWITQHLDTGSLQRLLSFTLLGFLILGGASFIKMDHPLTGSRPLLPVDGVSLLITAGMVAAALGTVVLHRQHLIALILIGTVGLVTALIFIKFSAPDLGLTQLSVEVVTVILLLLALYFLPQSSPSETVTLQRVGHIFLALAAGGGTAALSWAILTRPYQTISHYFLANSLPSGGGANVVNVILVDFRGYDTLGEISVLALAGLGIYAMLEPLRLDGPQRDAEGRLWDTDRHPTIMAVLARLLLPLALLVALFFFLRGHHLPGGGFIAGLVTAIALLMQYLANGVAWTHARLPWSMHGLIGLGLLIAVLTGLASFAFGYPFLTSAFRHLHWPVIGEFEVASAMSFDLGVYLVVVGATLLILIRLALLHRANLPATSRRAVSTTVNAKDRP
jgi:multicomponent K+:H+ antiporter subunit A